MTITDTGNQIVLRHRGLLALPLVLAMMPVALPVGCARAPQRADRESVAHQEDRAIGYIRAIATEALDVAVVVLHGQAKEGEYLTTLPNMRIAMLKVEGLATGERGERLAGCSLTSLASKASRRDYPWAPKEGMKVYKFSATERQGSVHPGSGSAQ